MLEIKSVPKSRGNAQKPFRLLYLYRIRNCIGLIALLLLIPSKSMPQVYIENAFPNLSFQKPLDIQTIPSDKSNRLFVVEKQGMIYELENDPSTTEKNIFLDITNRAFADSAESGLLGLAFHPNFLDNGYFYVNYTHQDSSHENELVTIISRFEVSNTDSNLADVETESVIIKSEHHHGHHNGGQLAFGPEGYLYIAFGDGGEPDNNNGQDLNTFYGAMLRIDVDNPLDGKNYGIPKENPFADSTVAGEIFAYGLRNPWRFSFDAITGQVWLGDVGHVRYEEINIILPGKNYGWKIMEGAHCYNEDSPSSYPTGCDTTGLTMPVWEYGRDIGKSITGGFIYRGSQVPSLYGKYIYGDFESGTAWALEYNGVDTPINSELFQVGPWSITSFGVDKDNELYICSYNGKIFRVKEVGLTVNKHDASLVPSDFWLHANYPNPFNPSTTISYDLPKRSQVTLGIYDLLGKQIKTLVNHSQDAGNKTTVWDGTDYLGRQVSAGVYLYQIQAGEFNQTRKMLLLK